MFVQHFGDKGNTRIILNQKGQIQLLERELPGIVVESIPVTGIAVKTFHKQTRNHSKALEPLAKRSARAERGAAAVEEARVQQQKRIAKVEAFRSKEDLTAHQSETAFMIVSCKDSRQDSHESPPKKQGTAHQTNPAPNIFSPQLNPPASIFSPHHFKNSFDFSTKRCSKADRVESLTASANFARPIKT